MVVLSLVLFPQAAGFGMYTPGLTGSAVPSNLKPPTAVIIQDTDMPDGSEAINGGGSVKITYSMPVTPPRSPR